MEPRPPPAFALALAAVWPRCGGSDGPMAAFLSMCWLNPQSSGSAVMPFTGEASAMVTRGGELGSIASLLSLQAGVAPALIQLVCV